MKNSPKYILTLVVCALLSWRAVAAESGDWLGLLPRPVSVEMLGGEYRYTPSARVVCDKSIRSYVAEYLGGGFGAVEIVLRTNTSLPLPQEGYVLEITPSGVVVEGVDRAGLLNGFHTLLQLFPNDVYEGGFERTCLLPCVRIADYPAYHYRGQHLDVARTFSTVEQIKEFIKHLAHHKINHLHLHLTDDEGWRVEIGSHPRLAEEGGWRGGDSPIWSVYGAWGERYGGYYTQAELRELVAYADQRGVTIVPEIDLPGHSLAIGKIYPEVLCPIELDNSRAAGYDKRNVWCVSREENYRLLEDILGEICAIFPSEYIHIGGDEVDASYWKACPHCSALYHKEGMSDHHQLQEYFMNRLVAILEHNGKKAAMWNEATDGGRLSHKVRIHGWEGLEECRKVAEAGYPAVVMPGPYFYFDMRQSKHEDGHNWAGVVTLEKCYSVNLDALGYSAAAKGSIVGFSGAFWSELYLTHSHKYENYLEYQTFPRICALAEIGWMAQERREWESFVERLEVHKGRMEAMGISYRRGEPAKPQGRQITPSLEVTTSLPLTNDKALSKLSAYANDYGVRTSRTCHEGDWILYSFAQPQRNVEVELTTGYRHVPRGIFPFGVVEVSEDGKNFKQVAVLDNGSAKITLTQPMRHIRLRSTATGNGDRFVYLQFPIIRK